MDKKITSLINNINTWFCQDNAIKYEKAPDGRYALSRAGLTILLNENCVVSGGQNIPTGVYDAEYDKHIPK